MKVLKRKDYPMHEHIMFMGGREKYKTYIHSICVFFLNRVDIHLFVLITLKSINL